MLLFSYVLFLCSYVLRLPPLGKYVQVRSQGVEGAAGRPQGGLPTQLQGGLCQGGLRVRWQARGKQDKEK